MKILILKFLKFVIFFSIGVVLFQAIFSENKLALEYIYALLKVIVYIIIFLIILVIVIIFALKYYKYTEIENRNINSENKDLAIIMILTIISLSITKFEILGYLLIFECLYGLYNYSHDIEDNINEELHKSG